MRWLFSPFFALYRYVLSPLIGPACRHTPSCSRYAEQALAEHGLIRGGWLSFKRICRCHPWGTAGYDPVPDCASKNSER